MDRRILAIVAILVSTACANASGPPSETMQASEDLRYDGPLRVTPDPVRFPDTTVGCVRSSVLRLDNSSPDVGIQIVRFETANDALRVTGDVPLDIPEGESRFVDLHFFPTRAGDGSGEIDIVTADVPQAPVRLEAIAVAVERPETPNDPGPLDLVLVLDVSTTMGTTPRLRDAVEQLFEFVSRNDGDVRIGLTSFVNDVWVHGGGNFLDRRELLEELDSQLDPDTGTPAFDLPRHQLNFDFPENTLAALYRSATEFPFRRETRRILFLVTDDTFLEPPTVFSDGNTATVSYAQVASALEERGLRLVSIHASARGRGLSSNYEGEASLVSRTGGSWRELAEVTSSDRGVGGLLVDLATGWSCH